MNLTAAKTKAEKIVSEMTVQEKMTQLLFESPAIERLKKLYKEGELYE